MSASALYGETEAQKGQKTGRWHVRMWDQPVLPDVLTKQMFYFENSSCLLGGLCLPHGRCVLPVDIVT